MTRRGLALLLVVGSLGILDASGAALQPLAQGGRLDQVLPSFHFRARFCLDLEDFWEDSLLETPWLDDVTFACQPLSGPRILSY